MVTWLRNLFISRVWQGALRRVAREQPFVLAISGSVGKTSTKDAIALVLAAAGQAVFKTPKSFNSEVGIPLALLGFEDTPTNLWQWLGVWFRSWSPPRSPSLKPGQKRSFVLEYSADRPGDICYISKQIRPNVVVLTRIAPSHLQNYPNFEALVAEETSLLADLQPGGSLIYNTDDPNQAKVAAEAAAVLPYGLVGTLPKRTGVWGQALKLGEAGWLLKVSYQNGQKMDSLTPKSSNQCEVQTRVIGRHQLYPLLAAAATAFAEGISPTAIKAGLEQFEVPPGRGRLIPGIRQMTLIDDTYNSSPEAAKAALEALAELGKERRTVAILGNMNELGDAAEAAHLEVARYAVSRANALVFVGPFAKQQAKAAIKAGQPLQNVISFEEPAQLLAALDQVVEAEDLVLVKGSQNRVRLERVVEKLMAHPEDAPKLLARQSAYWKKHI